MPGGLVAPLMALAVAAGAPAQETPAVDSVSVRLQQLYVTVRDAQGRRVTDLEKGDFTVSDGGAVQPIVTFARGDVPFTAVLLVDASSSMEGGKLDSALAGAQAFLDGMEEFDEAKLVVVSDRLEYSGDFSNDSDLLSAGLADVATGGGTATNDFLYLALKLLEPRQGRRTVVLLSDGEDVHSALRADDVLFKARHSQTLVYWIRILSPNQPETVGAVRHVSMWRSAGEHTDEETRLEHLVEESGGHVLSVRFPTDIPEAFRDVLRDLREQYVLGYYLPPTLHDQRWRPVRITVDRPSIRLPERGYIDY